MKLPPLLALTRPRLVPSAVADVVAGLALAGGFGAVTFDAAARGIVASVCLYAGGMVLNDVADVAEDRRLGRPRPIVTGAVTRGAAAAFGAGLLTAGIVAAPGAARYAAALIAALVLLYDFAAKRSVWLGAPVLGCCRIANVGIGWLLIRELPAAFEPLLLGPLLYGLYVAAAVVHGWLEDRAPPRRTSTLVLLVAAAAGLAVAFAVPLWWWAAAAALPTLVLALRARGSGEGWVAARTGILLRGLPRFTIGFPLGVGAWTAAAVVAVPAYVLPPLLRRVRWS